MNEVAVTYADSGSKEYVEKTRDRVNKWKWARFRGIY